MCEVGNSSGFDQLSPLICKEEKKRQESFRFEDDYEYEIFSILSTALTRQPSLFWLENVIAVVRQGLTSFTINNPINFFDKKKLNEAFWGVFFKNTYKTFKLNLVLVFVL